MATPFRAAPLASRAVHVKIYPTARTFAERREVLQVLARYGEVDIFRALKYHPKTPIPNAFLSIFSDERSAKDIIQASPIRYRLVTEVPPVTSPAITPKSSDSTTPPTPQPRAQEEKVFELHVSTSKYDHELSISDNPLHGPYMPVSRKSSYLTSHLESILPKSMWAKGLADWETDRLAWRRSGVALDDKQAEKLDNGTEIDEDMGVNGVEEQGPTSGGDYMAAANRVARSWRKRRSQELPRVMGGLKALSEEG